MTAPQAPIARLSERVTNLEQQKVTYRAATVLAVNKLTSTFDANVAGAGRLDGIPAQPQFMPAVGDTVQLSLSGAVPIYQPHRIGEGAIGPDELSPEVGETLETIAMDAANGKNKVTYSLSAPTVFDVGTAVGDPWFRRTSPAGVITGNWQWDGDSWEPATFGDEVLSSLTVGKLVGGTATFDLIVGGRIATANTGQRAEINALAIQAFNSSNTLTVNFDGANNLMTGQIRTATSGERLIMNPGGNNPSRLDFYPSTGSQFATIEAETISGQAAVLLTAGNASTSTKSGVVAVRRSFAHIGFGTRQLVFDSSIYADTSTVRTVSEIIDLQIVGGQGTAGGARIAMGIRGVAATQLNVWATIGNQPWVHAVNQDVGIFFGGGGAHIVGNDPFQKRDLNVASLNYSGALVFTSSEKIKTDIAPLRGVDVRQATRAAKAKVFRMPHRGRPARPADETFGAVEAVEAPEQIGLIAEELPESLHVVVPAAVDGKDVLGYDQSALIALSWSGLGDAFDDIEALRAEVATLRAALMGAGPKGQR